MSSVIALRHIDKMLKCTGCKIEKPIEDFDRDARRKTGRQSRCKQCRRQADDQYRELHRDEIRKKLGWSARDKYLQGRNYPRELLLQVFEAQGGLCYISLKPIAGDPLTPSGKHTDSIVMEHNAITNLFRGWATSQANLNFCKYDDDPEQAIFDAMRFYEADMASRELPPQWKLVKV